MSGVKHTSGPWKIDFGHPRGLPGGISTVNGGRPVTRFNTFARPTNPEAMANARLIAAAPELLEELKTARSDLADLLRARSCEAEGSEEDWLGHIDAAITRATGDRPEKGGAL